MMRKETQTKIGIRLAGLWLVLQSAVMAFAQEHGEAAAGHGGGHGEGHAVANPLKAHAAEYYSIVGFLVALGILLFVASRVKDISVRRPRRGQLLMEQAVASMRHFCRGSIGPGGEKFAPLIGTIFAYVLFSNLCGVLPFYIKPPHEPGGEPHSFTPAPTANLSMTLALGFIVFLIFNVVGIKANGVGKYLAHFAGPIPALAILMFPIEIVGVLVRPISLAMRLFGNVFGEETIIAVLIGMAAATFVVPLQAPMLAFGVFGSVVQAGVFAILSCSYIALAIGDHGHDHEEGHGHEAHGEHSAAHAH
jgi:F-type H+-transporting ATPase subunit a